MLELYQRVLLNRDFPEYNLRKGDIATLVDTVPHPSGGEEGYALEIFNEIGESINTVVVPFSTVEVVEEFPWDIIQIRVNNSTILDGSMPIIEALNILKSTKELLLYTALSTIEARPSFKGKRFEQANQYIEKVRVGQTQKGSYIFNVISPIDLIVAHSNVFERKVVEKMFTALSFLNQMDIKDDVSNIENNDLEAFINSGISSNFCESLIAISNSSEGQEIDFSIKASSLLEFPTYIPQKVKISSEIIPSVEKIHKKLKKRKYSLINGRKEITRSIPDDITKIEPKLLLVVEGLLIEGTVLRLEWLPGEMQGKVTILSKIDNDDHEVLIQLDQKDYYLAFEAQMSQCIVRCFGELIQENDTLLLKKVHNFSIIKQNE